MTYPSHLQSTNDWGAYYRATTPGVCAIAGCGRRHVSPDSWPPKGVPPIVVSWHATTPTRGYVEAKPKLNRPHVRVRTR